MSKEADILVNTIICGDWIDVAKGLPAGCVHTIITSPPYWGQRNYGVDGQLGLEKTPEEHIEKLVMGFRELRRILRDDGILWLNYGDKYANSGSGSGQDNSHPSDGGACSGFRDSRYLNQRNPSSLGSGLSQGNLIGLAWRLALALQADGWVLRSDVIWAKAISFNDKYSGSTMPESVNGTRWERCRVKKKEWDGSKAKNKDEFGNRNTECYREHLQAEYKDCPGCPKCEANDGLVLRRGSWRPTRAHEYLFQFVKQVPYYADMEAVREDCVSGDNNIRDRTEQKLNTTPGQSPHGNLCQNDYVSRNLRDVWTIEDCDLLEQFFMWKSQHDDNLKNVWTINPQSYKKAHYATFPEKLVEPCIKVSTSQKGICPKCGSQWARIIETTGGTIGASWTDHSDDIGKGKSGCKHDGGGFGTKQAKEGDPYKRQTLGWKPTCGCGCAETVPAIVYDPFMGSGTVAATAARMGRNYLGSELSKDYLENQAKFRISAAETGVSADEIESGQMAMFEESK